MIAAARTLGVVTAMFMLAAGGSAQAQSAAVQAAMAAGQIGERIDGYLGVRGAVSDQVRAELEQINIKRRALYTQRAQQRGVSVEAVAAATACQAIQRLKAGETYYAGGSWAVRGTEVEPKPGNCP